ncbi:polysaccharide biosynthesis/export family protein [Caenimonas soli]|uniref:polysaccharide biosynthesis/export family protein n=1 Tax=Caenimonas soli TaxID=2735555 RepID=UPI00155480D3|nr:polysaccharide biosynthesis/export family protein [Caenimonas soli]NPC57191.1 polysaccharide export protein [Caenimonas soli]
MKFKYIKTIVLACTLGLAGCSTYSPFLPSAGPSAKLVIDAPADQPDTGIQVVELSDAVVQRIVASRRRNSFVEIFGAGSAAAPKISIGAGDALEISVWEAPPAVLFGGGITDARGMNSSSRVAVLPEQMVSSTGAINMPFAGTIQAAGRTTQEIEQEIARRLKGKANDPQVLVRVLRNVSSMVTVVGEVNTSTRMALTPRGERLLDALATAGGVRQPVGKITLQVTREVTEQGRRVARVMALPLDTIISDPSQNIMLLPGDIVTALHQPNSMMVLGATARNEELNFEAQGITLAQALARAGGLQDARANAAGVFIFRFEDPAVLGGPTPARTTADGKVPVVYRVDLKDPAAFFYAQGFPMRNKDVMYVANAPAAELQKFLNLVSSVVVPAVTIQNLGN